ncbi:MAG: redoxin domain-containing protein [bacterium]
MMKGESKLELIIVLVFLIVVPCNNKTVTTTGINAIRTIEVTPADTSICIGSAKKFTAVAKDAAGNKLDIHDFRWESSDKNITVINSTGMAIGINAGQAMITVSHGYKSYYFSVTVYDRAPDFTLKDINSKNITLSSLFGNVIILNFWATWCGPCKIEIPAFVDLYKTYKDRGLVVIGVIVGDTEANVKAFMAKSDINYPILMGDGAICDLYGRIKGVPTTFIINRRGEIVEKFVGSRSRNVFEEAIKKLL